MAERHLCTGCGACAYFRPDAIEMVDDLERGRRPLLRAGGGQGAAEALAVCPGHHLAHDPAGFPAQVIEELVADWGPVAEVWEGYAADSEIRHAASSGGVASALALFGIEREGMHGLLHIAARPDVPYLNRTVLSRTRTEILAATGSRYAPASPCDGLQGIEDAPGPCVFIGKPCDVAAAQKARRLRPKLDQKLGLTIAIFCAGTPSTRGTLELIRSMGIEDPSTVQSVRYRGLGWPGEAVVRAQTGAGERRESQSYAESWDRLQRFRQWRCYVCADHTGEFADIAVGDPWYRPPTSDEPGRSLVLARTERGCKFLERANAAGFLTLTRGAPGLLPASQPNLLRTRGANWGRIWACRLLGVAAPRYENMPSLPIWMKRLTLGEKLRSILGTLKRTFTKRLRARTPVEPWSPTGPGPK